MNQRSLTTGLALGIVAFAQACTIRDITEVPVVSVEVQPSSITILEGETQRLTAQAKDEFGGNQPSGTVTWSSDAPSVFSIDNTGTGEALAPGHATIWATVFGTRGSGSISVGLGPRIVVSEPSLLFSGSLGGPGPNPITLRVTNGGGGSVGGISATVQYPEGGTAGWLSLALAGTSAPTTLTVSSLNGLLEEGIYDATLLLASRDARTSPVTVPVQAVVILDKPIIRLDPQALEFHAEAAGALPAPQTVQVTNRRGGGLSDLQASILYLGTGSWLSASLTGTTAPTELLIQPAPSGLNPGTYIAEVRVAGPGALNTPLAVDVTFTIDVGEVSPAKSTATLSDGTAGSATSLFVQARNSSGYALSSGGAGVVVNVSGANAAGPITAIDAGDGTYTASYTPTATGIDNVAITLNGAPLGGSPFPSKVGAGSACPANSTAKVGSGTAGLPTNIVVQARDAYGNPLSVGGETVVITVSGTNHPGALTVTDRANGTYTASYTPTATGIDRVAITMDGT
ncbi:MAG: Ig-like domain-containing protein, partial [Longimicrobiales bacterium]|nr:Ig-like domain-containing protein [Longimicrobiales bacterium]